MAEIKDLAGSQFNLSPMDEAGNLPMRDMILPSVVKSRKNVTKRRVFVRP